MGTNEGSGERGTLRRSTKGVPSVLDWKRVSSYKMAPEMYLPSPGAEKRRPAMGEGVSYLGAAIEDFQFVNTKGLGGQNVKNDDRLL